MAKGWKARTPPVGRMVVDVVRVGNGSLLCCRRSVCGWRTYAGERERAVWVPVGAKGGKGKGKVCSGVGPEPETQVAKAAGRVQIAVPALSYRIKASNNRQAASRLLPHAFSVAPEARIASRLGLPTTMINLEASQHMNA